MRRRLLVVVFTSLLAWAPAVHAEQGGVSVNADYAGVIAVRAASGVRYFHAECGFTSVRTSLNRMAVVVTGQGQGASLLQGPAMATYVQCSVDNGNLGQEFTCSATSTDLTPCVSTNWFVAPIRLCASGAAVYGPNPVSVLTMFKQCITFL